MTEMRNGNSNDDGANDEDDDDDCAADEVHIHISCTKFTPWYIDYPFPYFGTCSTTNTGADTHANHQNKYQGPILLTWINFNPSMDK